MRKARIVVATEVRTPPTCGSVQLFQPLGLGMEMFDPIGRFRTKENNRAIDPSVDLGPHIAGMDAMGKYADGLAAAKAIIGSARGRECFVGKYTSYVYGMDAPAQGDSCAIKRVAERFGATNLNIAELLADLTQESSFYYRQVTK